jgi:hypothetical protein
MSHRPRSNWAVSGAFWMLLLLADAAVLSIWAALATLLVGFGCAGAALLLRRRLVAVHGAPAASAIQAPSGGLLSGPAGGELAAAPTELPAAAITELPAAASIELPAAAGIELPAAEKSSPSVTEGSGPDGSGSGPTCPGSAGFPPPAGENKSGS